MWLLSMLAHIFVPMWVAYMVVEPNSWQSGFIIMAMWVFNFMGFMEGYARAYRRMMDRLYGNE